jgi:two-component system, response regulator
MEETAKRMLLVEDNPDHAELALLTLRECRPDDRVTVVHDGAEALDYLFARNAYAGRSVTEAPDVILLDLKLPKVDGLDVLEAIRANAQTKTIPVVVLTSSAEERDVVESYRRGANSYVRKPVTFEGLAYCLRQIQIYWTTVNWSNRVEWT